MKYLLVCYLTKWSSAETLESGAMNGVLNPIEIKKTSNPGTELIKVFDLLDRDNYIVPIWMI